MSIDFTLPPDVEETRARVREFMDEVVRPAEEKVYANAPNGEPDREHGRAHLEARRELTLAIEVLDHVDARLEAGAVAAVGERGVAAAERVFGGGAQ